METLSLLPVLNFVFKPLKDIIQLINRRRTKELDDLIKYNESSLIDEKFRNIYVTPLGKELLYYRNTGIKTHHYHIEKYVDFLTEINRFGEYNWKHVTTLKKEGYLRIKNGSYHFNIENYHKITFWLQRATSIFFFLIAIFLFIFIETNSKNGLTITQLVYLITLFISLLTGIYFAAQSATYHLAKKIDRIING